MKIESVKDRNKVIGPLIQFVKCKTLLYLDKTLIKFELNKMAYGWYFVSVLFGVGFNFYFEPNKQ